MTDEIKGTPQEPVKAEHIPTSRDVWFVGPGVGEVMSLNLAPGVEPTLCFFSHEQAKSAARFLHAQAQKQNQNPEDLVAWQAMATTGMGMVKIPAPVKSQIVSPNISQINHAKKKQ